VESYGWPSILPPVIAIALAIRTKQVYFSLALFLWLGWTIMSGWNPVAGLAAGTPWPAWSLPSMRTSLR